MPEPKIIKAVTETICPHCSKKVMVSFRAYLPLVDWSLKREDLEAAKEKLKKGVGEITFDDPKRKEDVLSWIEKEEFIIGPEEVDPMLVQILKDNTKQKEDDPKEDKTK
jgi:hypothetical protein